MSRKVSYANYSEVAVKNSPKVEEEDSEVKSTYYSVETHQQPRVSCFNMCIKLLPEVYILPEREVLLLVLLCTLQKTQKLEK